MRLNASYSEFKCVWQTAIESRHPTSIVDPSWHRTTIDLGNYVVRAEG
jgi:hypothetical protein